MGRAKTAIEAFYEKTTPQESGCLFWAGGLTWNGYGQLTVDNRRVYAHRTAWIINGNEDPKPLDLDHICHNQDPTCIGGVECLHRRCVRLSHLVPKTRSENLKDSGRGLRNWNAFSEKHAGHELSQGSRQRRCLTCRRERYHRTGLT